MCTYRYDYNSGNTLKIYKDYERLDIYDRYITKLKPITKEQFDICRFKSGKYLFRNKDNSAYCTACDNRFEYIGGKHKEIIKCPQCGKEVQLHNTWRTNHLPVWHDWYAFIDTLEDEENTVALRYILTEHHSDGRITCQEDARVIWNVAIDDEIHYEWAYDPDYDKMNWRIQNTQYFNYYKGMTPNNYICTDADWHDDYVEIFQSLSCFSNINLKSLEYGDFAEVAKYAGLVEKLQKMGLEKLAVSFLRKGGWTKDTDYFDMKQTEAMKMLKINRNDLKLLIENQTVEALKFLQNHPNCNEKEMENFTVFGEFGLDKVTEKCKYYYIKRGKTINYIKNKVIPLGLNYTEYLDYLDMIDRLQYPIDNQYAYPKDFEKFKEVIVERYNEMSERERNMTLKDKILEESQKDEKIHLISKALQESKELRKWFEGSDGLKVFVPESVGDLLDAGVKLHNCLGNYANKILSNESLVMFIRRIDDTDDNYIAMEYAEGKLRQLREDNQRRVNDPKIINFAEALVKKMNEIRVQETIVEEIIKKAA